MKKMDQILHFFSEVFSFSEWQSMQVFWKFQGPKTRDFLSPSLFILVIEALRRMMDKRVRGGYLKGFNAAIAGVGTVSVSHFCLQMILLFL